MPKYKYVILILLITLMSVHVIGCGKNPPEEENNSVLKQDMLRIPKLTEGVEVYALEKEVINILGPENVAISTDRSSGSGILWQYDGTKLIVVTAGHLMTDFETGELELWSGEKVTFSTENVRTSSEIDVAAIHIFCEEPLNMEQYVSEDISAAQQVVLGTAPYLAENPPEIGDTMWLLDSAYGAASGIRTGQVSAVDIYLEDYDSELLLINGTGKTGMSGGPVYDAEGRLAAMVSGMSEDGNTLAAVPVGKIMKFLETLAE